MIRNTQKLLSKVVVYLALVLPAIIVKAFLTFFFVIVTKVFSKLFSFLKVPLISKELT